MTNEELSLKTKQSLAQALKNTMEHKKLSKITISELCAVCRINRKTFYYHFEDIYFLLKWTLEQEAIEVVKHFDLIVNTEEAIRFVMDYVDENKHIINSAFDSMGYEEIKRFFYNDLFPRATSQADMLACPFGDCREGQIPRSSAALQV